MRSQNADSRVSPARFVLRVFRQSKAGVAEYETLVRIDGELQPALIFEPAIRGRDRPAWILLHGMTVPGRHHAGVFRFGRALAAAGAVVVCPEVAEWTRLRVDPKPVHPTLVGAARFLAERADVAASRIAVLAFSIAVPASLAAVAREPLKESIAAVTGFGASCDLQRTARSMLTGQHEWQGTPHRLLPDPYGRWIVGANFLDDVSDEDWGTAAQRRAVAECLHRLAVTAGRNGTYSDDPVYDPLKERLGQHLDATGRKLWSLLAPPAGRLPDDLVVAGALADALAAAILRQHPELDARPHLANVRARVHLVHGYADQLVPFTETLRLASAFPPDRPARVTITRLFGHARREVQGSGARLAWSDYPAEMLKLVRTLREVVLSV